MKPRKTVSRRFFSRSGRTPYHGSDRRVAGGDRYFGMDRRSHHREPARTAPVKPREPIEILSELDHGPGPTRAAIAARAEQIYRESGCVPGHDNDNWLAAEAALRREMRQAALEKHHRALAEWQKMLDENGWDHPEAQDERLWLSRLDRC